MFVNLTDQHLNLDHCTHVAEDGDAVTVTHHGGTVTRFVGSDAAAIRKAVGAKAAKADKPDDDETPHARSHHKAH